MTASYKDKTANYVCFYDINIYEYVSIYIYI